MATEQDPTVEKCLTEKLRYLGSNPGCPAPDCVALGKLTPLSETQFPPLWK